MEVILRVGAEGGDVTLYGVKTERGWRFSRTLVDQTPGLIDEPAIAHETGLVTTWDEALALIDRYPWQHLVPVVMHPEFASRVRVALEARTREKGRRPRREADWQTLCGIMP